jgi:hypothetical protein
VGTRSSYTQAHWMFFWFHILETEVVVRQVWFLGFTAKKRDDAMAAVTDTSMHFNTYTRNYYVYSYSFRFAMWMAKILSTSLVLFWYDVATSQPIVQFNLLA